MHKCSFINGILVRRWLYAHKYSFINGDLVHRWFYAHKYGFINEILVHRWFYTHKRSFINKNLVHRRDYAHKSGLRSYILTCPHLASTSTLLCAPRRLTARPRKAQRLILYFTRLYYHLYCTGAFLQKKL